MYIWGLYYIIDCLMNMYGINWSHVNLVMVNLES